MSTRGDRDAGPGRGGNRAPSKDGQTAASPEAGDNPGYAEDAPDNRRDANRPHGEDDPPSPDEGGMRRDPDASDRG